MPGVTQRRRPGQQSLIRGGELSRDLSSRRKTLICQDLAATWGGAILALADPETRAPNDRRGNADAMRTSEVFWKLFSTTGSISAYLMCRHFHPSPAN